MKKNLFFILSALVFTSSTWATCLTIAKGLDRYCARNPKKDVTCHKTNKNTYGFHPESCLITTSKAELIQGILNLEEDGVVPASIIKNQPRELIVRSLLYRNFQNYIRPNYDFEESLKKPLRDFYSDSQLQMAISVKNLPSILSQGFKNQHQTGTTNGCDCSDDRASAENDLINASLEESYSVDPRARAANFIRPKYSFLGFKAPFEGYTPGYTSYYGELVAVFKNSVKRKTTYTLGDSLSTLKDDPQSLYYELPSQDLPIAEGNDYYEAQIWGDLKASDISYFLINCFGSDPDPRGSAKKLFSALAKAKKSIPLYSCTKIDNASKGFVLKATKLITLANVNTLAAGAIAVPEVEPEVEPEDPYVLSIVGASYGLNLSVKNKNNVLADAKEFCDDKSVCDYKVDPKFFSVGDLGTEAAKSFSISWKCKNSKGASKILSKTLPADATGEILSLSCL